MRWRKKTTVLKFTGNFENKNNVEIETKCMTIDYIFIIAGVVVTRATLGMVRVSRQVAAVALRADRQHQNRTTMTWVNLLPFRRIRGEARKTNWRKERRVSRRCNSFGQSAVDILGIQLWLLTQKHREVRCTRVSQFQHLRMMYLLSLRITKIQCHLYSSSTPNELGK